MDKFRQCSTSNMVRLTALSALGSMKAAKSVNVHYNDVIMSVMASQITRLIISYSTVYWGRRSKKTSKLHVTGLCEGNSPVTGEFPAQRASNAINVFIWWRHNVSCFIVWLPILSISFKSLHWHWNTRGNLKVAPVSVKQSWISLLNTSHRWSLLSTWVNLNLKIGQVVTPI